MSDERDQPDAAGGDSGGSGGSGGSHTGLATRPVLRPQRPTGKRSRQVATTLGDSVGGGVDVLSTATELSDSSEGAAGSADAETKKIKKVGKKAQKAGAPSRSRNLIAPIIYAVGYVYNYLKQVSAELRKVIWPNRKQMITYTSVVLTFLVFMVALIAGSDYGFAKLVLLVFGE